MIVTLVVDRSTEVRPLPLNASSLIVVSAEGNVTLVKLVQSSKRSVTRVVMPVLDMSTAVSPDFLKAAVPTVVKLDGSEIVRSVVQ